MKAPDEVLSMSKERMKEGKKLQILNFSDFIFPRFEAIAFVTSSNSNQNKSFSFPW